MPRSGLFFHLSFVFWLYWCFPVFLSLLSFFPPRSLTMQRPSAALLVLLLAVCMLTASSSAVEGAISIAAAAVSPREQNLHFSDRLLSRTSPCSSLWS